MIISPAKSLNFSKKPTYNKSSIPLFLEEAIVINSLLKKKSPKELSFLMKISEKLSNLNWSRNQEFTIPFNKENARPAIYTFDGDVYSGIDAFSISEDKMDLLQGKLIILSASDLFIILVFNGCTLPL